MQEQPATEVTDEERQRAREQFLAELEARAAEGPEAVAEFFEMLAAVIRLALLTPEEWAQLFSQLQQQPAAEQAQPVEQPTPQEPQQEVKTESVREKLFSPRSAGSRARGKSLREILNV